MAVRVFSTPHLAELFRDPSNTEICKNDWMRIGKFLDGLYPKPMPEIVEWEDSDEVLNDLSHAQHLVIDTEWHVDSGHMYTLGIGGPDTSIHQWWPDHKSNEGKRSVYEALRLLVGRVPIWFQNAFADLPTLKRNLDLRYEDFLKVEDTLMLFSVLWCELPKNLEFLDSLYGQHEKMKHLPSSDPRYNAGDIASTLAVVAALTKEAQRDPQSLAVYNDELLPLIPIILEAQSLGIRVARESVKAAERAYNDNKSFAEGVGSGYAGFPLNLGSSKQLCQFLTHDLLRKKPLTTVDEDTIAALRTSTLPFDPQEEVTIESVTGRIDLGAHPVLESRVLYARAQQYLSHYVEPMLSSSDGRVYPKFHPWAQNTGRWSTVDPPLAQLPSSLRAALLPDPNWLWFEFDWSAIELRLIAALAGDTVMLEAFEKNWDLHTYHLCEAFGYRPPKGWTKLEIAEDVQWVSDIGGKEFFEVLRTFMKTTVFRLCYGGAPEGAPAIPGAQALGFKNAVLVTASKQWIAKHQPIKKFWHQLTTKALRDRVLRTFLGRKWNFLSHDLKRVKRQMYDFPMQGGVSGIKNRTLIQIKAALGDRVRLSYEMHDSLKLQIKRTATLESDKLKIIEIAEQPWTINGRQVSFPVEWKERS